MRHRTSRRGPRAPGSASNRASARSKVSRMDGDVGVEEEDQGRAGGLGAEVSCGGRALGPWRSDARSPPPVGRWRPSHRSSRRRRRSARNRSGASREAGRRQRSKSRPPLRTGTTTESVGLRGPGLVGPAGTSSMIYPRPSERLTAGMRHHPWDRPNTRTEIYHNGTGRWIAAELSRCLVRPLAATLSSRRAGGLYPEPLRLSTRAAPPRQTGAAAR